MWFTQIVSRFYHTWVSCTSTGTHPSERISSSIVMATRKRTITCRTPGMNTKVYSWTNRCTLTSDIALTMTYTHTHTQMRKGDTADCVGCIHNRVVCRITNVVSSLAASYRLK